MEYTELADYALPSGVLTEWYPAVADDDAWRDDDRQLSYMHLEHARRAYAEGDAWFSEWIGTAFAIHHRLDADVFSRTLLRWYARHEAFRASVVPSETSDGVDFLRRTVSADAISVEAVGSPEVISSTSVFGRVSELFNTRVNPLHWPPCIAVTIAPADDSQSFLVIFAADHTVMDAYTQVFAIKELTAIYESELLDVPDQLHEFGSYLDFSDAERTIGSQITADDGVVSRWTSFFKAHHDSTLDTQPHSMPRFPVLRTSTPPDGIERPAVASPAGDSEYQASLSRWLLNADETERFHQVCKKLGANMQAGIYTALSITNSRLAGNPDLRFISPVHTRTEVKWGESAGWFVGIIPVHLRPGSATSFSEAITALGKNAAEYKELGTSPYYPIADLIGDRTPPQFVISYIDLRNAEGSEHWDARQARVLRSSTRNSDEVYLWINRIPKGTNISARFSASQQASDTVHRYISTFNDVLRTVIDDGDALFDTDLANEPSRGDVYSPDGRS